MNEIQVMSKELSELIAAGEVIERPSSVIKELLENAIDSGASNITVEIKNGGITYMRVTDNGKGISKEDLPLAFLRHATSKLHSQADLNRIMTLGFRGEALASICAVSKVDVISKRKDLSYGTHYCIEGSAEKSIETSGCPDGTTIIVRDIFYNVPARLKFLKKAVTEGNAVSAIISKIALSHPETSIKYIRDNKQELLTSGDGKLYSAIYAVFGREFAMSMIPVDYEYNSIRVEGFTVKPLCGKPNRTFQNFFINMRYVKSVTCTVSLEEAYRNIIMTGKFPACVLNISIPPDIVDVNVHPAKIEVRFSDEKKVFDSIFFAVKNSLLKNDKPQELKLDDEPVYNKDNLEVKKFYEPVKQYSFNTQATVMQTSEPTYLSSNKPSEEKCSAAENDDIETHTDNIPEVTANNNCTQETENKLEDYKYINTSSFVKQEVQFSDTDEQKAHVDIRVIGEIFRTYILAEAGDELVMIDKHAAHERLIFNRLKEEKTDINTQMLLEPINILLTYEYSEALISNTDILSSLGFAVKKSEGSEITVDGIPVIASEEDVPSLLSEIAQNIIDNKNNPQSAMYDDLYHSMACKAAIKAHDKSDISELVKLATDIYNNEDVRYCPHGRPVLIKITKKDIEKHFKRLV